MSCINAQLGATRMANTLCHFLSGRSLHASEDPQNLKSNNDKANFNDKQNDNQQNDAQKTQISNNNNTINESSQDQVLSLLPRYTSQHNFQYDLSGYPNNITEIPTFSTITDNNHAKHNNTSLSNQFEDISDDLEHVSYCT
ncbi:unnamed protein product [Ceratitis capitata]|uniref:(Mediterranean fruit fly) hypothetical protein n=1 Tax=Ceratitis capitata TaxID=7213 RepID=A0A811UQC9_CERCA|nr:unnamed protein product [Ceratitis capitata]